LVFPAFSNGGGGGGGGGGGDGDDDDNTFMAEFLTSAMIVMWF